LPLSFFVEEEEEEDEEEDESMEFFSRFVLMNDHTPVPWNVSV